MIGKAIKKINPNAVFTIRGDEIEWHNNTQPIDKELILSEVAKIQEEYESKKYQRDRANSYPSIQDQLDMLYWDKVNGTENWLNSIESVKNRFPKA